jgi:hypothetical protein
VVVRYVADAQGGLVPAVPLECPSSSEDPRPCAVRLDHYRERKTGPCFPLAVARCRVHGQAFTLYPPGHVPYGRVAVGPVTADGELVRREGAERAPDWSGTLFGAATDAVAGEAWPREKPSRFRTQRRWLERCAAIVGIAVASASQSHVERVARQLGTPTLALVEAGARWSAASGYQSRGAAVSRVLGELRPSEQLGDRVLAAGAIGGLWGRPSRWDPGGGWRSLVQP